MCLSVIKVIIVETENGSMFFLLSFSCNKGGIYYSQNYKSNRTSKLHDRFKSYNDFNDVFGQGLIRAVAHL